MREPEKFSRCLFISNGTIFILYAVAGIGGYMLGGNKVASVLLESASPHGKVAGYGAAFASIIVAGVIIGNVQSKNCFEWKFPEKGPYDDEKLDHGNTRLTRIQWYWWSGIVSGCWASAFLLSNLLPFFAALLALIGALVGTWMCLGFGAMFGLRMLLEDARQRMAIPTVRNWTEPWRLRRELWGRLSTRERACCVGYFILLVACLALVSDPCLFTDPNTS